MAFVKENIRDIVFGSSNTKLFSFGGTEEEEDVAEERGENLDIDVFEELKITKYIYSKRQGLFCREKSLYFILIQG
jgi:hypothetical protein